MRNRMMRRTAFFGSITGLMFGTFILLSSPVHAATSSNLPNDYSDSADYAKQAIAQLFADHVLTGDENGDFNPQAPVTRAQIVTMLVRALNLDATHVPANPTFRDVPRGNWAYDYVEAAYQHGIIAGVEPGLFGAADVCSREQMSAMFTRALGLSTHDILNLSSLLKVNGAPLLRRFTDARDFSNWAKDPATFAVYQSLLNGTSAHTFDPKAPAQRQQVAVVTDHYIQDQAQLKETASAFQAASTAQVTADPNGVYFKLSQTAQDVEFDVPQPGSTEQTPPLPENVAQGETYISPQRKTWDFPRNLQAGKTYTVDYLVKLYNGDAADYETTVTVPKQEWGITSLSVVDVRHIRVNFNHSLDYNSSVNPEHYLVTDNSTTVQVRTVAYGADSSSVVLELAEPLTPGTNVTVAIPGRTILPADYAQLEQTESPDPSIPEFESGSDCAHLFPVSRMTAPVAFTDTSAFSITGVDVKRTDPRGQSIQVTLTFNKDLPASQNGYTMQGAEVTDDQGTVHPAGQTVSDGHASDTPGDLAYQTDPLPTNDDKVTFTIYTNTYNGQLVLHLPAGTFTDASGNPNGDYTTTIDMASLNQSTPAAPVIIRPTTPTDLNTVAHPLDLVVQAQAGDTIHVMDTAGDEMATATGNGDQDVTIPVTLQGSTDLMVTVSDSNGNFSPPACVPRVTAENYPPNPPVVHTPGTVTTNQASVWGTAEAGDDVELVISDVTQTLPDGTVVRPTNDLLETIDPSHMPAGISYQTVKGIVGADGSFNLSFDISSELNGRVYVWVSIVDGAGNSSGWEGDSFVKDVNSGS